MSSISEIVKKRFSDAEKRLDHFSAAPEFDVVGRIERMGDDVATVSGLPNTRLNELLLFERTTGDPVPAMALALDVDSIGCAMLGHAENLEAGNRVRGTGTVASVPVGESLLGRVVDSMGNPLDGGSALDSSLREPVDKPAPGIIERDFVNHPLYTGLAVIDAMLPLGRGQRELIIGDRETGKTAIAVDTIVNQRDSGVICVYCAVGQKLSSVIEVIDAVKRYGAPQRCIFVIAAADDPPGLQWLAPYAACTMAEYFSERGGDALLVIDDLTQHAVIYRQLSLLLRNPPGREAYPGDIFYIHSRLLERAAKLGRERGGGSLTALPIAATEEGNLSGYIPTNLISITDGQIVLEPRLFHEGQKPAINVGKSVSRVGGKSQVTAMRQAAETLRLEYSQFLELEIFTRFGGMVDERTKRIIEHGRRIRAILTQPQFAPLPMAHQIALLLALNQGTLDRLPLEKIPALRDSLTRWSKDDGSSLFDQIARTGEVDDATRKSLLEKIAKLVSELSGNLTPSSAPS